MPAPGRPKVFAPENLAIADYLGQFPETHGHSLLELAFSWLASRPVVASPMAGTKAARGKLSAAEPAEMDRILGRRQGARRFRAAMATTAAASSRDVLPGSGVASSGAVSSELIPYRWNASDKA
jgi:aryl-alcohol dehydrogenase-like predicted oxidoreductase